MSYGNFRFFPNSTEDPERLCAIPSGQNKSFSILDSSVGFCSSESASFPLRNYSELDEFASAYAPVLFFHPQESYSLTSIESALSNHDGQIKFNLDNSILSDTINMTILLNTTRDFNLGLNKEEYVIQSIPTKNFLSGDGYDTATGKSRASIYYNAFQYTSNVWVFNYWFYYPYSGPTTMAVLTTSKNIQNSTYSNATNDLVNWYTVRLRPFGEREGNWQSMSVAVCAPYARNQTGLNSTFSTSNMKPPIAVSYHQYMFREVRDCTIGQCVLYEDTIHPVGFVARDTHVTYPVSSTNVIFTKWNVNFLLNLRGIFGIDQTNFLQVSSKIDDTETLSVKYNYFYPNNTNVIRHERPSEINSNESDPMTYWRAFAGTFGLTKLRNSMNFDDFIRKQVYPNCSNGINDEECPNTSDDPTFYSVLEIANVFDGIGLASNARKDLYDSLKSFYTSATSESSTGPVTQLSFTQWIPGINAPIRNDIDPNLSSQQFCDSLIIIDQINFTSTNVSEVNLRPNMIGISFTMVFLFVINFLFIIHPKLRARQIPILRFDPLTGVAQPPNGEQAWQIFRPCVIYCIFYIVTMIGAALYTAGYVQLLDILESSFTLDLSAARQLSTLFGIGVIAIDTLLAVFIWFPTRAIWHQIWASYFDIIGNYEQMNQHQNRIGRYCGRPARIIYQILYGALFNSLILAVLCVLIGSVDVGVAYIFGGFCNRSVNATDEICINLYQWGLIVPCGKPIVDFCNLWATRSSIVTLWGGSIVVAGQYYLIDSCGAASAIFKSVPYTLSALPSRLSYRSTSK